MGFRSGAPPGGSMGYNSVAIGRYARIPCLQQSRRVRVAKYFHRGSAVTASPWPSSTQDVAGHDHYGGVRRRRILRGRPMRRVLDPLELMGRKWAQAEWRPPAANAPWRARSVADPLPHAVARRRSNPRCCWRPAAPGVTTVIETEASRDHTELMLKHFGAEITSLPRAAMAARSRSPASPNCAARRSWCRPIRPPPRFRSWRR